MASTPIRPRAGGDNAREGSGMTDSPIVESLAGGEDHSPGSLTKEELREENRRRRRKKRKESRKSNGGSRRQPCTGRRVNGHR